MTEEVISNRYNWLRQKTLNQALFKNAVVSF